MLRPTSLIATFLALVCLIASASALASRQHKLPADPNPVMQTPALGVNTTADFQNAVLAVEEALSSQQFDKATALLARLPHRSVRVAWDDSIVPAALKPVYSDAAQRALTAWQGVTTVSFHIVGKNAPADIRISFQPTLNPTVDSDGPPGVVTLAGVDPGGPPFEVFIGLKRTKRLEPTTNVDVMSDVAYAIGTYFGLGPSPVATSFMHHSKDHTLSMSSGDVVDFATIQQDVNLAEQLGEWAAKHERVEPGLAKAVIDPIKIAPKQPILQGDVYEFSVQVTNTGKAPLTTALKPDCSCFSTVAPKMVAPGETVLYPVKMATITYGGTIDKTLYMLTSDPDRPMVPIPLTVNITPRCQFILPGGSNILLDHSGTEVVVYMAISGTDLNPNGARVEGVEGTVSFEPWTGSLADPALGEPVKPRKGYKFTINLGNVKLAGRELMSLVVETEDPVFRQIRSNMYIQDGLVASPNPVILGHLAPVQREFSRIIDIDLGRKPFHIIGVKCDNPHLKVTQFALHPWEHMLSVTYDGRGEIGELTGTITVTTDYPDQRIMKIPVQGSVD